MRYHRNEGPGTTLMSKESGKMSSEPGKARVIAMFEKVVRLGKRAGELQMHSSSLQRLIGQNRLLIYYWEHRLDNMCIIIGQRLVSRRDNHRAWLKCHTFQGLCLRGECFLIPLFNVVCRLSNSAHREGDTWTNARAEVH